GDAYGKSPSLQGVPRLGTPCRPGTGSAAGLEVALLLRITHQGKARGDEKAQQPEAILKNKKAKEFGGEG
ncbi:MAG: hypothetical protein AB1442_11920, partial [Nitrospirota bacterium]